MHARSPRAPSAVEMARTFYEDVLGGKEVLRSESGDTVGRLSFLVGSTLLEAPADGEMRTPIVLEVDRPEAIAERCWDAGFAVHVWDDATGRTRLSVVDPFDRRIDLMARGTTGRCGATSRVAAPRDEARAVRTA
jgi:catechol 2,3-dioxygenase-like lactoylglutathione lyase family enzyme